MKKFYVVILLAISFPFYGQIVNIPDANFKNALVTTNCAIISGQFGLTDVDIDNDGEIQQSEALTVNSLYLSHFDIASLIGISYFLNLQYLICPGNLLQELDLTGLSQIAYLDCDDNVLTSLDLSTLSALQIYTVKTIY